MAHVVGACLAAAALSLAGLLASGARWRRGGAIRSGLYAAGIAAGGALIVLVVRGGLDQEALLGSALAFGGALGCARARPDWNPPGQAFLGILAVTCVAFVVYAADFTLSGSLSLPAQLAGIVLIAIEVFALGLLIVGTHEVLDVVARVRWRRRTEGTDATKFQPFVSIQVPTHNEPPELVQETLRALSAIEYPSYEVLVLDNNTEDPALWEPLSETCRELGFRFVHLENWPGFKAGALNHGLEICDERAEVIAVVDADFIVAPDFLARTAGYFADPQMAIVQTAQGFRSDIDSAYLRRLALTYKSFDEITMPSRNERNGIIFAGTMGLLRRSALVQAGGWGEWCVTEDAEVSLRILARGYTSVYVEREFGRGVMPLTFAALKRQRFRWCLGGVQLLRRHWRILLTGRDAAPDGADLRLTRAQRYDYLSGALQWFQALVTVGFTALLLVGVTSDLVGLGLTLRPLAGLFVAAPLLLLVLGLAKGFWGLRARLRVGWLDAVAVFGIFVSLSWAVALACLQGLTGRSAAFLRTPKFSERQKLRHALQATKVETAVACLCGFGAVTAATAGAGLDSVFLAILCGWSTIVFSSAPATAYAASRAELPSDALRRRRELDGRRTRMLSVARPRALGYAGAAATVMLLFMASTLAIGPTGGGIGGLLRPGSETEARADDRRGADDATATATAAPSGARERIGPPPAGRGREAAGGGGGGAANGGDLNAVTRGRRPRVPSLSPGDPRPVPGVGEPTRSPADPAPGGSTAPASEPEPGAPARPSPSPQPGATPGARPTATPTPQPGATPDARPTATPTPQPRPSPQPTATPTPRPTPMPRPVPTPRATTTPSPRPTATPTPP